jgi:hypothetical protein
MARLAEALERRDQPRVRGELPCALLVEGRRHRGLVQDLSPWGLFVRTPGDLPAGADAIVTFWTSEGRRFVLEASVPHRRCVSLSLDSLSPRGVGLHIQNPPTAYRRWIEGLSREA